jgi:hypothetical protein
MIGNNVLRYLIEVFLVRRRSRIKSDSAVGRLRLSDIFLMKPLKLILLPNGVDELLMPSEDIRLPSFTFML